MLSWRRVALTFSLCSAAPQDLELSNYSLEKKCKTDKCTLGGQREKANRPVPGSPPAPPPPRSGSGGKHDVVVKRNPGLPPCCTPPAPAWPAQQREEAVRHQGSTTHSATRRLCDSGQGPPSVTPSTPQGVGPGNFTLSEALGRAKVSHRQEGGTPP